MVYCCPAEPQPVRGLHCHPQSSTSISCSWAPPEADYDSYTIECVHSDSQTLVYSRRTGRQATSYLIPQLEPHKLYSVCVKVIADGITSEAAHDHVVTMIDRKLLSVAMKVHLRSGPPYSTRDTDLNSVMV